MRGPHREAGNSIGEVRRRDLEHLKCLNKYLKQQIQCPKVSNKSNSTTDLICLICGQRWPYPHRGDIPHFRVAGISVYSAH
jgi:hypothetical protein